eukprot:3897901-Rhodomonas_salina.1
MTFTWYTDRGYGQRLCTAERQNNEGQDEMQGWEGYGKGGPVLRVRACAVAAPRGLGPGSRIRWSSRIPGPPIPSVGVCSGESKSS